MKVRCSPQLFRIYLWGIGAIGLISGGLILYLSGIDAPWDEVLIFAALALVSDVTTTDLPRTSRATLSISSAVNFAALLVFGPQLGALVAMVSGVATTYAAHFRLPEIRRGGQVPILQRAAFNMGNSAISTLIAGLFYIMLGGHFNQIPGIADLPAIVVAAAVRDLVNVGFVVLATALLRNENPLTIWKNNFRLALPMNVATMAVGGSALAMAFQLASFAGLAVFFLPVLLTSYAFRVYAAQAKEQMERLESIVAERTRELRQTNEELQRIDQRRAEFVSVLNHEMRTPLTSIIGFAELLLSERRGPLTVSQRSYVKHVKDGGERLLSLVNEVLNLSRIEAGEVARNKAPLLIADVIQDIWDHLRPLADEKYLKMNMDLPADLPIFNANPDAIDQILSNLLSNAIKYTPDGGILTLSARVEGDPPHLAIAIRDTGIGIAADDLPMVFERFYRVSSPEVQQITGTGLGLAIVKGLVEAMGGQINVESELGAGSCFTVHLPLDGSGGSETESLLGSPTPT